MGIIKIRIGLPRISVWKWVLNLFLVLSLFARCDEQRTQQFVDRQYSCISIRSYRFDLIRLTKFKWWVDVCVHWPVSIGYTSRNVNGQGFGLRAHADAQKCQWTRNVIHLIAMKSTFSLISNRIAFAELLRAAFCHVVAGLSSPIFISHSQHFVGLNFFGTSRLITDKILPPMHSLQRSR